MWSPLDFRGPDFLLFYLAYSACCCFFFRAWLERGSFELERSDVDYNIFTDPYLIAYLRGGVNEAIKTAVVSLCDRGILKRTSSGVELDLTREAFATREIEKNVASYFKYSSQAWQLMDAKDIQCKDYEVKLINSGLIYNLEQVSKIDLGFVLALVFTLGLGAAKLYVAISTGHTNVLFLMLMMIAVVYVLTLIRRKVRLTRLGRDVMSSLQDHFQNLKSRASDIDITGSTNEVALLIGVYGMSVISDNLHYFWTIDAFRRPQHSSGGSDGGCGGSGCDSSSGGGGCGGGGCGGGGCGGCGG